MNEIPLDQQGMPLNVAQIDENGVDLTALQYYLAMTPTERFQAYQRQIKIIFRLWRENNIEPEFECEYA
jgi:hypothetical protein